MHIRAYVPAFTSYGLWFVCWHPRPNCPECTLLILLYIGGGSLFRFALIGLPPCVGLADGRIPVQPSWLLTCAPPIRRSVRSAAGWWSVAIALWWACRLWGFPPIGALVACQRGKHERKERLGLLTKHYQSAGGALTKHNNAPIHMGLGNKSLSWKPRQFPKLSSSMWPLKHY